MTGLTESDYVPLDDFPLIWRWADRWRMPDNPRVTSTFRAIRPEKARELHAQAIAYHLAPVGRDGDAVSFASDGDPRAVRDRLLVLGPSLDETVIVSWDQRTAITTSWGAFCVDWDDFCYPGCDDVTVWPLAGEWSLAYARVESFRYHRWKSGPAAA